MSEKRDVSLDFIRIIAIFFVLFTHTGTMGSLVYQTLEPKGIYYIWCIFLSIVRIIAVPLFLMISGALLLGRNESFKILCKKRIFRILIVLIIFSFIQELLNGQVNGGCYYIKGFLYKIIVGGVRGEYWYLYCYLAYLLFIPFLKKIANCMDSKFLTYLILLSTVVDLIALIQLRTGIYISFYNYAYIINGYAFLFPLCGYGIYKYLQSNKLNIIKICFYLGIFLMTSILLMYLTHSKYMMEGIWEEGYTWRLTVLLAVPVFVLTYDLIRRVKISNVCRYIIAYISDSCFGIYLCENILEHYTIKVYHWIYELSGAVLTACFVYLLVTIITGAIVFSFLKKCIPAMSKIL